MRLHGDSRLDPSHLLKLFVRASHQHVLPLRVARPVPDVVHPVRRRSWNNGRLALDLPARRKKKKKKREWQANQHRVHDEEIEKSWCQQPGRVRTRSCASPAARTGRSFGSALLQFSTHPGALLLYSSTFKSADFHSELTMGPATFQGALKGRLSRKVFTLDSAPVAFFAAMVASLFFSMPDEPEGLMAPLELFFFSRFFL